MDARESIFFAGDTGRLRIYGALTDKLRAQWPEMTVEVKKTQISFKNGHIFACASIPRMAAGKGAVQLTFGLPYRADSPRLFGVSEPYPMRWTHHTLVRSSEDIDAQLMDWLAQAYCFAAAKRKGKSI